MSLDRKPGSCVHNFSSFNGPVGRRVPGRLPLPFRARSSPAVPPRQANTVCLHLTTAEYVLPFTVRLTGTHRSLGRRRGLSVPFTPRRMKTPPFHALALEAGDCYKRWAGLVGEELLPVFPRQRVPSRTRYSCSYRRVCPLAGAHRTHRERCFAEV